VSVSIRRLVLDVLKPREVAIVDISKALCGVDGVEEVDVVVTEVDVKTETIKLTIKGPNICYDDMAKVLIDYSCAIRSIDEVNVYKHKPEIN
jgi:hypothetical protein